MDNCGKRVSLVGAGPGDMGLVTIKAVECIKNADVIIYDNLINPTILNIAGESAKLVYAGKISGDHHLTQDEINAEIVSYARQGCYVVRLKGGDPYIFGRGGEEAEYLTERGIDFEIVHGVSSFYAGLGYAGIPVTYRGIASSFHVFTGHKKDGDSPDIDFSAIAGLEGSLVFLMGISNLKMIADGLIQGGKNASARAALIENGTGYNQRVFRGNLSNIADIAEREGVKSPAIIAVGEVCGKELVAQPRVRLSTVRETGGVLSGKNILLTGTRSLTRRMSGAFQACGGNVCEISLILTRHIDIDREVLRAEVTAASHIFFTSANGVDIFFESLRAAGEDIRILYGKKICVIGSGSGEALKKHGINADFVPEKFDSQTFLNEILPQLGTDSRVLIPRAVGGSDVLPKGLKAEGVSYTDMPIYETGTDYRRSFDLNRGMPDFDYIVVASASAARALYEMTEDMTLLENKIISIGPVTTRCLRELGIKERATADRYNAEGIIDAIKNL